MPLIEITDPLKTVEIATVTPITSSDGWVAGLIKQLDDLNAVVPLTSFLFDGLSGDQYQYEFIAQDGRQWHQVLTIPGSTEAAMTFDVPDPWLKSEFAGHRPIRDAVISLAEQYGCDHIEVIWAV